MTVQISIIMPVYNGEKYLSDCLDSVLKQSFVSYELIAINDGSTDNSLEILREYQQKDNRIKVHTIANNGPGNALNFGITCARGDYLCFIDQDDMIKPEHLKLLYDVIERYRVPVAFCEAEFCSEEGHTLERIPYPHMDSQFYNNSVLKTKNKLCLQFVPQWTKIIHRGFWLDHKIEFPGNYNKSHDLPPHILLMFFADEVAFVTNPPTYLHRIHDKQITNPNSFKMTEGFLKSFVDIIKFDKKNSINNKKLIAYASQILWVGKYSIVQNLQRWSLLMRYRPFDVVKKICFSKKNKNGYRIIRVLFFKYKYKIKTKKTNPYLDLFRPNIRKLGNYTYSAPDLSVANPIESSIGSFCSIGKGVTLGHGDHPTDFLSTSPYFYFDNLGYKHPHKESYNEFWNCLPVKVGNDVWIGDNVFVKNGVTIGDGAIIGACAIVTKDIPPYSIAVGNPARIIKYRFEKEIIQELLELKWWNLNDEIIKSLPYSDINKTIEYLKSIRDVQN